MLKYTCAKSRMKTGKKIENGGLRVGREQFQLAGA